MEHSNAALVRDLSTTPEPVTNSMPSARCSPKRSSGTNPTSAPGTPALSGLALHVGQEV
jgi:hypothetical protein